MVDLQCRYLLQLVNLVDDFLFHISNILLFVNMDVVFLGDLLLREFEDHLKYKYGQRKDKQNR